MESKQECGIDLGWGDCVEIVETYTAPTSEYPDGSYLRTIHGVLDIATGLYAVRYPNRPSLFLNGKPPFVGIDMSDWGFPKDT